MTRSSDRAPGERHPVVVAVGSGAGGVGRTTLAMELARVFSRRGVATVLVDCALRLPLIAEALGRGALRARREAGLFAPGAHVEDFVQREEGNLPALLTLADAVADPERLLATPPSKFIQRLRRLHDGIVILDLPAGLDPFWLTLMMLSDVPVVVSGPEAWSVRCTAPFFEAAALHAEARLSELGGTGYARTYLILNGCRDASERELGEVLCHTVWRKFGHYPRYLGPVDHDDRRWFHLRHSPVCPPLSSPEGLGVQIEEIAKRMLALEEFDRSRPRDVSAAIRRASPQWLGLSDHASATELRLQYRRLWEGYRRESAISQVLLEDEERARLIAELESTHRALQTAMEAAAAAPQGDSGTRGLGDLRTEAGAGDSGAEAGAGARARAGARDTGTPDSGAEALEEGEGHCGSHLRELRRDQQMSLRELSLRTKIGIRYLEAIEAMETETLPQPVYLRGYLREIARVLSVPVDSLLDRYLTELAERVRAGSGSVDAAAGKR